MPDRQLVFQKRVGHFRHQVGQFQSGCSCGVFAHVFPKKLTAAVVDESGKAHNIIPSSTPQNILCQIRGIDSRVEVLALRRCEVRSTSSPHYS